MVRYVASSQERSSFSGSNTTRFILSGLTAMALFQLIQNLVELLRREMLVKDVIDHQHRCAGAGGETLLLALEEDAPVGGALVELDAELALRVRDEILTTVQHARDVGADADVVAPARVGLEHGVEARDLVDLNGRQLQVGRHGIHQLRCQIAVVLLLCGAQRRDAGGALSAGRKLGDPVVDLPARVLGERRCGAGAGAGGLGVRLVAQRSISPKTMSCVPITATTSAIMWPRIISSSAARCANPGARHLRRYGLLAPSETR